LIGSRCQSFFWFIFREFELPVTGLLFRQVPIDFRSADSQASSIAADAKRSQLSPSDPTPNRFGLQAEAFGDLRHRHQGIIDHAPIIAGKAYTGVDSACQRESIGPK